MARLVEQPQHRGLLDDLSRVHHQHPVRHLRHQADIVGNQDHRHPQILLQFLQELHDLRLDGHVQSRRRLVRDQKPGPAG